MESTRDFCKRIKYLPVDDRTRLVNERLNKTKSTLTGWQMFTRIASFGCAVAAILFLIAMILY